MKLIFVQHGIEFGYVGGDPAELMRICVENGTFTVSFLKEGVQKVCVSVRLASCHAYTSHTVPRLDRRPSEDFLGSVPRDGCPCGEPKCNGRLSHRRGFEDSILPSIYHDMVPDEVA